MNDTMNEITRFSPFGGQLIFEEVKGTTSGTINPENNVETAIGADRSMYSYVPRSGCPHAKQCQVLMMLRDDSTEESAMALMKKLKLDELAEERHFILLFPNPLNTGWNYREDADRDNDIQFIVRCFAALPKSKGKVSGFNGMIFLAGSSSNSSAMAAAVAVRSPLDAAAVMIGEFPADYQIPDCDHPKQVAWVYEKNAAAEQWLKNADAPVTEKNGCYENSENASVKFWLNDDGLNENSMRECWEQMFSTTRKWRNDTFGTYQPRIDFTAKGFTAHVNEELMNDGIKHTWYEYIPEQLKGRMDKVPLLFYFHGINCNALYGAEQSGWSDIAERDGFITVFPNPAIEERWNVWDDRRIPSDVNFVLALIEHMKAVHPIDESRIYISGFSMGSMFTNALAQSYPEKFAGAVAANGPDQGYFLTLEESAPGLKMFRPNTIIADIVPNDEKETPTKVIADQKKKQYDWKMPFVQFAGQKDGVGFAKGKQFPMKTRQDGMWIDTIRYWQNYNGVQLTDDMFTDTCISGLKADYTEVEKERFLHQTWTGKDGSRLYHFITVERMPHAVDLNGIRLGWDIIKHYSRNNDGSLEYKG